MICLLFVPVINMPRLGESSGFPCRQAGLGELHVAAARRNPLLLGRGSCGDSAEPICSFAELFTKMKGLGVAAPRVLLGRHLKNLLRFLPATSFSGFGARAQ